MPSLPLAEAFARRRHTISDQLTQAAYAKVKDLPNTPPDLYDIIYANVDTAMGLLQQDLSEGTFDNYPPTWEALGAQQVRNNFSLGELMELLTATEQVVIEQLAPFYGEDASAMRTLVQRVYQICGRSRDILYHTFNAAREEIIRAQTVAINELSAPIVPIYNSVLVLPLIGAIDSRRAVLLMESLLDGVARRQASIVLLDITGVPIVDTGTAHHLIQAARAVRLLGAQIVLVGIGPEIAQTIVQLGVDLSGIVTRSDLQAGFAFALEQLGHQIAPIRR